MSKYKFTYQNPIDRKGINNPPVDEWWVSYDYPEGDMMQDMEDIRCRDCRSGIIMPKGVLRHDQMCALIKHVYGCSAFHAPVGYGTENRKPYYL